MPSPGALANRRLLLYLLAAFGTLSLFFVSLSRHSASDQPSYLPSTLSNTRPPSYTPPSSPPSPGSTSSPKTPSSSSSSSSSSANTDPETSSSISSSSSSSGGDASIHHVSVDKATLHGEAIMPKLANETLKAELGRAAWKLFHTTMARFPDKPTEDERTALFSYIHLFARLYPCGECASHFRQILVSFPPQVATRNIAAGWACHVHNEVNRSLGKAEFDCNMIGDFYDCGCAHDDKGKEGGKEGKEGKKEQVS